MNIFTATAFLGISTLFWFQHKTDLRNRREQSERHVRFRTPASGSWPENNRSRLSIALSYKRGGDLDQIVLKRNRFGGWDSAVSHAASMFTLCHVRIRTFTPFISRVSDVTDANRIAARVGEAVSLRTVWRPSTEPVGPGLDFKSGARPSLRRTRAARDWMPIRVERAGMTRSSS